MGDNTAPTIYSVELPELSNYTGVIIKTHEINYASCLEKVFYTYIQKNETDSVSHYTLAGDNTKAFCRVFTVTEDTVSWEKGGYFQTNIGYQYHEDDRHVYPVAIYGCNIP